jgi:hypothetical protein
LLSPIQSPPHVRDGVIVGCQRDFGSSPFFLSPHLLSLRSSLSLPLDAQDAPQDVLGYFKPPISPPLICWPGAPPIRTRHRRYTSRHPEDRCQSFSSYLSPVLCPLALLSHLKTDGKSFSSPVSQDCRKLICGTVLLSPES